MRQSSQLHTLQAVKLLFSSSLAISGSHVMSREANHCHGAAAHSSMYCATVNGEPRDRTEATKPPLSSATGWCSTRRSMRRSKPLQTRNPAVSRRQRDSVLELTSTGAFRRRAVSRAEHRAGGEGRAGKRPWSGGRWQRRQPLKSFDLAVETPQRRPQLPLLRDGFAEVAMPGVAVPGPPIRRWAMAAPSMSSSTFAGSEELIFDDEDLASAHGKSCREHMVIHGSLLSMERGARPAEAGGQCVRPPGRRARPRQPAAAAGPNLPRPPRHLPRPRRHQIQPRNCCRPTPRCLGLRPRHSRHHHELGAR